MNGLLTPETEGDVKDNLANIAKGENELDEAYSPTMTRIQNQEESSKQLAVRGLTWIVHAKRQLSIIELRHALAVRPNTSRLDLAYCPSVKRILSVCVGLVKMDEKSEMIDLVHKTTRDYFKISKKFWFPDAESEMTTTSITYLSFDALSGYCKSSEAFEDRLRTYPLYDYVSKNWGHHAREASTLSKCVVEFLQIKARVEASSQALMARAQYDWDLSYKGKYNQRRTAPVYSHLQRSSKQMTALHLASYFGIEFLVRLLLEQGADLMEATFDGRTPLYLAAGNGHFKTVQLLLAKGAFIQEADPCGRTPQHRASTNTFLKTIRILLERGGYFEAENECRSSPLHQACYNGHLEVVRLLLDQGANIMATAISRERPIFEKVSNSHFRSSTYESTPLHEACCKGHIEVVRLLLDRGADIAAITADGETSLIKATAYGHLDVAQLLLDRGANITTTFTTLH